MAGVIGFHQWLADEVRKPRQWGMCRESESFLQKKKKGVGCEKCEPFSVSNV